MTTTIWRRAPWIGVLLAAALWLAGCAASRPSPLESPPPIAVDAYLNGLVGDWDIARTIRGKVVGNKMTVSTVLDGKFIQLHMESTSKADPYEALVLIGFDVSRIEYVAYWCDSFGPDYSAVGRGKRVGQRLELVFAYPDAPFYNTLALDPSRDEWTFTGENGAADGSRRPFCRDVVTRRPR